MACLSDNTWVAPLSNQLADCASLRDKEHGGDSDVDGDTPSFISAASQQFRLERVFPVYAMGSSKPPAVVGSDLGDPIWDAVRQEAKLDVRFSNTLFMFMSLD